MKKDIHNKLIEFGSIYLEDMLVIDIEGDKSKVEEFLQGQVTSDTSLLSENSAQLSCICDHKGLVLADFIIIKKNEKYKFIVSKTESVDEIGYPEPTDPALIPVDRKWGVDHILIRELTPFAKFSNVKFKKTDEVVIGSISPKNNSEEPFLSNDYCQLSININTDLNTFEDSISAPQWEAANKILGNLMLRFPHETEKFRPLEINYDKLRVSFDKGCYRGQEIVARMKYLGVDRRKFCTFITEEHFIRDMRPEPIIDQDSKSRNKKKLFKPVGSYVWLDDMNVCIFNAIVKKDDLPKLIDLLPGVIQIL